MRAAKKPRTEGVKICLEIIEQVREIPGVHGVHIMAIDWERAGAADRKGGGFEAAAAGAGAVAGARCPRARVCRLIVTETTGGSLTEFLDALGSSSATPGGGAGAAVALGMGAALVAMTARLTTGRRKFRAVQADMERVIERCDAIRATALDLAEADAEAYGEVMAAYGLPRRSDDERSGRRAADCGRLRDGQPGAVAGGRGGGGGD